MLRTGIVGLPNVGKSTLFNALTRSRKAESANYPFCTIDPNVGVVQVPDDRMFVLQKIAGTQVVIPAAIEFVDIAGLVAGASQGEGLGNQFLSHIREVDAIIQVVRCFEDDDIIHQMGSVDPLRDIEVINTELVLSDLSSSEKQRERLIKKARGGDKEAIAAVALLDRIIPHLNEGKPVVTMELSSEDKERLATFHLLSGKPTLYACNVAESDLANGHDHPLVAKVRQFAAEQLDAGVTVISAQIEADLVDLPQEEAAEYLKELGVTDSGVSQLIRSAYSLLGLKTYFTAGEKEVRAWTFTEGMKAPQCAGVIHTDFEKGFIKAEVVAYDDLVALGSVAAARDAGKYRIEGKEYLFKDGDVAHFRFSP